MKWALIAMALLLGWREWQSRSQLAEIRERVSRPISVSAPSCPMPMLPPPREVAGEERPRAAPPPPEPPRVERAEPEPRQTAALEAAQRRLDAVLSRGRLESDDLTELLKQLEVAGDAEAARDVARRIAVAVNTGRLVPQRP